MKKQPEITDATREAFIRAFCVLSQDKPVNCITIRELTKAAGYNRTTYYRYFADVYALLNRLEDDIMNELLAELPDGNPSFKLDDRYFKIILEFTRANELRMRAVLGGGNRGHFIAKLQKWLISNQLIGAVDSPHNIMAMTIYFSGLIAALTAWLDDPKTIGGDDLLAMFRRLFSNWYLPELEKT